MLNRKLITLCCALALVALGGLSACDDDESSGNDTSAVTYHGDVKDIIDTKCVGCHQPGQIAPFSLQTYEQVEPLASAIRKAVASKEMPPWPMGDGCRDFTQNNALSGADYNAILAWVDQGAQQGTDTGKPPLQPEVAQGLSRVDLTLTMPEPYMPVEFPDEYRCFLIEWPYQETKYISGFNCVPGNEQTVHHVAAYLITPDLVANAMSLQGATPIEEGYACYGGPGLTVDLGGQEIEAQTVMVGAWAAASNALEFPQGTGIKVEPGSYISLQVHYNMLNGIGTDQTSIEFKIEDTVDREGFMLPVVDFQWVVADAMTIPADDPDVAHTYEVDLTGALPFYTLGRIPAGAFDIFISGIHMHTRGTSGNMHIKRPDGSEECLLDIPRWDFDWQLLYTYADPTRFYPGDVLHLECRYDNTTKPGETPKERNWGEGTDDEMCAGLLYIAAAD